VDGINPAEQPTPLSHEYVGVVEALPPSMWTRWRLLVPAHAVDQLPAITACLAGRGSS
jgi:hypothetical protein